MPIIVPLRRARLVTLCRHGIYKREDEAGRQAAGRSDIEKHEEVNMRHTSVTDDHNLVLACGVEVDHNIHTQSSNPALPTASRNLRRAKPSVAAPCSARGQMMGNHNIQQHPPCTLSVEPRALHACHPPSRPLSLSRDPYCEECLL